MSQVYYRAKQIGEDEKPWQVEQVLGHTRGGEW